VACHVPEPFDGAANFVLGFAASQREHQNDQVKGNEENQKRGKNDQDEDGAKDEATRVKHGRKTDIPLLKSHAAAKSLMYIRDTDGTIREPLLRGLDDIGSVVDVKANGDYGLNFGPIYRTHIPKIRASGNCSGGSESLSDHVLVNQA